MELFDLGAGVSEPTADENVQVASCMIFYLFYIFVQNCGIYKMQARKGRAAVCLVVSGAEFAFILMFYLTY